ncbi:hypothetical protein Plhal304r1_c034g0106111 [Plasmopara halstedii]
MECSLAFNSMLSLKMAVIGAEIAELVQLRTINRVFSATWTGENFTFATKWKRVVYQWWNTSESTPELNRTTKALEMFELALMPIAPTIFVNDHSISRVSRSGGSPRTTRNCCTSATPIVCYGRTSVCT